MSHAAQVEEGATPPGTVAARRRYRPWAEPLSLLASVALAAGLVASAAPGAVAAQPAGSSSSVDSSTESSASSAGGSDSSGGAGDSASTDSTDSAPSEEVPEGLEDFYGRQIDWQPCEESQQDAQGQDGAGQQGEGQEAQQAARECATVQVPLDYDDPSGQTIDLALKRLPASGQSQGSLFTNPGGPGDSGVELVDAAEGYFSEDLRQGYDIVGFDPRGVGQSTPLECMSREEALEEVSGESTLEEAGGTDALEGEGQEPSPGASLVEQAVQEGASQAAACLEHSPVPEIIDHMDTQSVARDMDVLRAQSGDEKLAYLGFSYGTFLGAVYADLFPGNVGRMVLDGAMDPSMSMADIQHSDAVSFQASLTSFVSYWQQRGNSPLTGTPEEGTAQLVEVVQALNNEPVTDPGTGATLGGEDLTELLYQAMYNDAWWDSLATALGPVVTDRAPSALVERYFNNLASEQTAASLANRPAINAINCLDNPVQGDLEQWEAQFEQRAEVSPLFGANERAWSDAFCSGWGRQAVREPAEIKAEGAAPILVVGTTQDPATPYQWAQSLADQLESGHLLTAEGNKHCAYSHGSTDCVDAAVDAYLLRGELPQEGTSCALPGPEEGAGEAPAPALQEQVLNGGRQAPGQGLALATLLERKEVSR
ncbi:alpha/beta hydrolase [Actinomyces wuliandei]|uniref:alpha/beta hydrolase n=1 Tax=Actinomyces wuliandei TaxID=2057743 RepID=UPI000FD88262|nr:alpha/beta hydrolase [Actinomyces wuliandei]